MRFDSHYQNYLNHLIHPRSLVSHEIDDGSSGPNYLIRNGKRLLNFGSSNYLGLNQHITLIEKSHKFAQRYGIGSGASRSVTANLAIYEELEQCIAAGIGTPCALILGTGFQTNSTVLETILESKTLQQQPIVFCDRFCHASIYQGIKHLRPNRFRHNQLDHLEDLLNKHEGSERPKFIIAESVYSMEGDQVDMPKLIGLAKKHQAFLYLDDAHAVGVYGNNGWGSAADYRGQIDLVMGTFSKALGSFGAYVGCSLIMREYLINRCKGLIYSTSLPPPILGAISAVIDLLPTLHKERLRVLSLAEKMRHFMSAEQLNYGNSTSHIVPWIIGSTQKTLYAVELLENQGILSVAIRPPSVPEGKSRIRFCFSAMHTDQEVDVLMEAMRFVIMKM
jgi:8-amino-7-oxononanoate synthase